MTDSRVKWLDKSTRHCFYICALNYLETTSKAKELWMLSLMTKLHPWNSNFGIAKISQESNHLYSPRELNVSSSSYVFPAPLNKLRRCFDTSKEDSELEID